MNNNNFIRLIRSINCLKPVSEQMSEMGFSYFLYPFFYQKAKILISNIHSENYDIANFEDILLQNISNNLNLMLAKVLILELNIERLHGNLEGDSSQERLKYFLNKLQTEEYLNYIFNEYPVLNPLIEQFINSWEEATLEFFQHIEGDIKTIRETFLKNDKNEKVINIFWAKGDRHQKGRAVAILEFSLGIKIVYKPRNFSTDKVFREIITWTNKKLGQEYFYQPVFIDKLIYGWAEFIPHQEVREQKQVESFYEKLGSWLAILYVLQATDMHSDNIIAYNNYPVIIDTETIFQSQMAYLLDTQRQFNFDKTVLKSNILPAFIENMPDGFDISAINVDKYIELPVTNIDIENRGRDDMRFTERSGIQTKNPTNQPLLTINKSGLIEFLPYLLKGFRAMYLLFLENKLEFENLLNNLQNISIRFLPRNTFEYGKLIESSYHTDFMQKIGAREMFLADLQEVSKIHPALSNLIEKEITSILQGEVPLFTSSHNQTDIYFDKELVGKVVLEKTGLQLTKEILYSLSEADYQRQCWLIETTLLIKADRPNIYPKLNYDFSKIIALKKNELHQTCIEIGYEIMNDSFCENDKLKWFGVKFSSSQPKIEVMDTSIYRGQAGLLLYYTYLGKLTNDYKFIEFTQQIYNTICLNIDETDKNNIGAFTGLSGIAYSFLHYAKVMNVPMVYIKTYDLITAMDKYVENDTNYDIIYGSAGVLLIALAIYKQTDYAPALNLAKKCAYHLIKNANKESIGWSWGNQRLTGLSHGTAGVAMAFVELYEYIPKQEFLQVAIEAYNYENANFSTQYNNWYDLRNFENQFNHHQGSEKFSNAWCHGANGIGLSRIKLAKFLNTTEADYYQEMAIQQTIDSGLGYGHCLCHGDLGNIELLMQANNTTHQNIINHVANNVCNSFSNKTIKYGNQLNIKTFDLMTGLAGIGYQLLRIANPASVPSVLTLQAPN